MLQVSTSNVINFVLYRYTSISHFNRFRTNRKLIVIKYFNELTEIRMFRLKILKNFISEPEEPEKKENRNDKDEK